MDFRWVHPGDPSVGWSVGWSVRKLFLFKCQKWKIFLMKIIRPTLRLLNVFNVVNLLNVLNVLDVLKIPRTHRLPAWPCLYYHLSIKMINGASQKTPDL